MSLDPKYSPTEQYLIAEEVARMLRCSKRTLARMRALGTGPTYLKTGGRILYPTQEIHDWVARNTTVPVREGGESTPRIPRSDQESNRPAHGAQRSERSERGRATRRETAYAA